MAQTTPREIRAEIDGVLTEWRAAILQIIYRATAIIGFFGIAIMVVTDAIPHPEQRPQLLVYIPMYSFLVFMALRPPSSSRVRGWGILFFMWVMSLLALSRGGLAGDGRLFLVSLPLIISNLANLVTLGEARLDLPVKQRPNSLFMLVDGVITIAVILLFVAIYYVSVRSAVAAEQAWDPKEPTPPRSSVREALAGRAFPILGLAPTVVLIVFFVVVPLVFATLVAFTNYSAPDAIPPAKPIDWVGLENFGYMFGGSATWTGALVRVFT